MIITALEEGLHVKLQGSERFWALRSELMIPRENILAMHFEPVFKNWRTFELRLPGASIPGKLLAGSFWTDKGWDFLYVKNPHGLIKPDTKNVLVIETDQRKFRRIIISYSNVRSRKLLIWWGKKNK